MEKERAVVWSLFGKRRRAAPMPEPAPVRLTCRCCGRGLRTREAFEPRIGFFSGLCMPRREAPDDPWRGRLVLDMYIEPDEMQRLIKPGQATERDRRRAHARNALFQIPMKKVHTAVSCALVLPCPGCGEADPIGVA